MAGNNKTFVCSKKIILIVPFDIGTITVLSISFGDRDDIDRNIDSYRHCVALSINTFKIGQTTLLIFLTL